MKIRFTTPVQHNAATYNEGETAELPEAEANSLIAAGLAESSATAALRAKAEKQAAAESAAAAAAQATAAAANRGQVDHRHARRDNKRPVSGEDLALRARRDAVNENVHQVYSEMMAEPPAFDAQIPKIAPVKPETLNAAFCSSRALYAEVVAAAVQAT